jgi:hypothetical protein
MTARQKPDAGYVAHYARVVSEILRERGSIPREELEYVVETVSKLKDERLKAGVAGLVGWGDDDRAELETFFAVAIEVLKTTNLSKIRAAVQTVELRFLMRDLG